MINTFWMKCNMLLVKSVEFQEYLRNTTPTEYKSRNLMSGDTILKRY